MKSFKNIPDLSVVIPVHNEIEVLPLLCKRLLSAISPMNVSYEIIFIDDGSDDSSVEWLTRWGEGNCPGMVLIQLSRCFGKENAVSAGLKYSRGKSVVVMDADLQDPPELIPDMYNNLSDDIDVVAMRRTDRTSDSFIKRATAKAYYRLMNLTGDINTPEDVGDYRIMSREVVNALNSLPEQNRCMKTLFSWVGFRYTFIDYTRPERAAGETKWSASALIKLATDSMTSHSLVPLRLATLVGFCVAVIALLYGTFTVAKTLIIGEPVAGYTTILLFITLLGGIQLLAIGILGEYVGRCYLETKRRPLYIVKRTLIPNSMKINLVNTNESSIKHIHQRVYDINPLDRADEVMQ